MGEHKVNILLRKVVHGVAIGDNVADVIVVILHMWFLAGLHGITIEDV